SRQFEILVDKLLQHDTERELRSRFEVPARELATGNVLRRLENVPAGSVLAICSRCQLVDGSWGHIPMMDFHCSPTAHRLEFVRTALVRMGQHNGVILESGRSYHYYGFEVLNEAAWERFLRSCLLLMPFTDARYIAH